MIAWSQPCGREPVLRDQASPTPLTHRTLERKRGHVTLSLGYGRFPDLGAARNTCPNSSQRLERHRADSGGQSRVRVTPQRANRVLRAICWVRVASLTRWPQETGHGADSGGQSLVCDAPGLFGRAATHCRGAPVSRGACAVLDARIAGDAQRKRLGSLACSLLLPA